MFKKELLYLIFGIIFILLIKQFFKNTDALTFSKTEELTPLSKKTLNRVTPQLRKIVASVHYIPYPSDPSIIKNELENIKKKQGQLTSDHRKEIYQESKHDIEIFAREMTSNPNYIAKIQNNINTYIDPIIMHIKIKFNRVRPYHLDKDIHPTIEYPGHPSYPSGHATQIYYIAYYMTQKEPQNRKKYFKIAKRVAENREYAGVHYESDSKYGQIIGEYLSSIYNE